MEKKKEWSKIGQDLTAKGETIYCPNCNFKLKGERFCPSCNSKIIYQGESQKNNIESSIANGIRRERNSRNHGALAATGIIFLGIAIAVISTNIVYFLLSGAVAFFAYQKIANKM